MEEQKSKFLVMFFLLLALLFVQGVSGANQSAQWDLDGPRYDEVLSAHLRAQGPFSRSNTNTLLLKMSWFLYPNCVFEDDIQQDGKAFAALVTPFEVQGGGGFNFTKQKITEIEGIINSLPPAPKKRPPQERWLLVSSIRSGKWVTFIYDRRDVPIEVEKLFETTGMHLEWSLPTIYTITNFTCPSCTSKSILQVAGEASTVASFGLTSAKITNIHSRQESVVGNPTFDVFLMCAAVSSNGRFVAFGGRGVISLFDCKLKKKIWENVTTAIPMHLAIVQNNKMLIASFSNGDLEKWDLAKGQKSGSLQADPSGIAAMATSNDGRFLAIAFGNGLVRVWDTLSNKSPKSFESSKGILSLAFSPDNRYLATSVSDRSGVLEIWDWLSGNKILTRRNYHTSIPDPFDSLAWSPDGNLLVANAGGQGPIIFETKTWMPLAGWGKHYVSGGGPTRVAFLPDGSLVGQNDTGSLEIIDAKTLKDFKNQNADEN